MHWAQQYAKDNRPDLAQISAYVDSPLWQALCGCLEQTYGIAPVVEHSVCSGAPGWNVKYRKSGRALCTLYPAKGYFTCLVSIGSRQAMEAELLLAGCTDYVRALYWQCRPFNGGRWLMIEVTSPEILADVQGLIQTRLKPKREKRCGNDD